MMKTTEILEQSHTVVMQALDDLSEDEWDVPGVCGEWSVKDIIAHLASYERLLLDAIYTVQGAEVTPYIRNFLTNGQAFNEEMVAARKYETAQQVLNEYEDAQVQTTSELAKIPDEKTRQAGILSWFGPDRCLADFVNMICTHSQEHSNQIIHFRQRVEKTPSS
jgi:uncharacterized protein (TIGR03083 family)